MSPTRGNRRIAESLDLFETSTPTNSDPEIDAATVSLRAASLDLRVVDWWISTSNEMYPVELLLDHRVSSQSTTHVAGLDEHVGVDFFCCWPWRSAQDPPRSVLCLVLLAAVSHLSYLGRPRTVTTHLGGLENWIGKAETPAVDTSGWRGVGHHHHRRRGVNSISFSISHHLDRCDQNWILIYGHRLGPRTRFTTGSNRFFYFFTGWPRCTAARQ